VDHETAVAYLSRVGMTASAAADAAGLRTLHRAHQLTVPFENLSIHLGEPISLDEDDLIDKIVRRRRGGFCYELNGAFALLLETLGAQVSRVAARVYGEAGLSPPFDHLALIVRPADGSGPWLADVGYGSHSDYPLLLDAREDQDDPAGRFRLADTDAGDIDVLKDDKPQYRIETRERSLADCVPTCWWQQTSPLSHFTRSTICSRLTPGGRVSISGRMLIQTQDGTRAEQRLDTDDALLAAYRDHFGVVLSRVPDEPVQVLSGSSGLAGSSGAASLAACSSSRRTSRSMIDSRCTTVLMRLIPRNSMGNAGQKKPPPVAAIQITTQMMVGTRKPPNDSSTSLRHLRAARVLRSADRNGAGTLAGPSSGGTRSVTREDTSPRVRLPYRVFSLSSYSSRVRRPSA
jgi:N-hydroxyarylamine O-acetyltransferase